MRWGVHTKSFDKNVPNALQAAQTTIQATKLPKISKRSLLGVNKHAEKIIHPFLFCVYNRLRGGRSSTLSLCDFSISCFDHLKIYYLSSKRWCCNSKRGSSSVISGFKGLSIVKFL
jgi:hypothetical protein